MNWQPFVLIGVFVVFSYLVRSQPYASVEIKIQHSHQDSIGIRLAPNAIYENSKMLHLPLVNGAFSGGIPINQPTYFSAFDGVNYLNGLLEPGDSTFISYDADKIESTLKFEGKGKEKFSFLSLYMQFNIYKKLKEQIRIAKLKKYPFDYLFAYLDSLQSVFLKDLYTLKSSFGEKSFSMILGDIIGNIMLNKYRSVGLIFHESIGQTLSNRAGKLTSKSIKQLQNLLKFNNSNFESLNYITDVYTILFMDYDSRILSRKLNNSLSAKYNYLNYLLPSNLKIPVLTLFLEYDINKLNQGEDLEKIISETFLSPEDSLYKKYIMDHYNTVASFKRGVKAPDFTLENENGEKISLSTFKGKVIFIDFWYAACGPCHAAFETLKPVKKHYAENNDIVFLCVSIDSKEIWKSALKKYNISGYHAFTENKSSNHPIIKDYKVQGYPTTLIIDKKSNVFIATPPSDLVELQRQIDKALSE